MTWSRSSISLPPNYIPANPLSTPASIVPEWYLLPYYAILRSIPNKTLGVVAMIGSLVVFLGMTFLDFSPLKSSNFRPLQKILVMVFFSVFWVLMILGARHVEEPFIGLGQAATALYFGWFLVLVPLVSVIETVMVRAFQENTTS